MRKCDIWPPGDLSARADPPPRFSTREGEASLSTRSCRTPCWPRCRPRPSGAEACLVTPEKSGQVRSQSQTKLSKCVVLSIISVARQSATYREQEQLEQNRTSIELEQWTQNRTRTRIFCDSKIKKPQTTFDTTLIQFDVDVNYLRAEIFRPSFLDPPGEVSPNCGTIWTMAPSPAATNMAFASSASNVNTEYT